ncbi:Serine/threonine-protein kinase PK-1 [Parafrankia sp. Ea1.12]|uniref:Stk1 family PASTA domain-containing Ser/Thr kinase n=1 Tax=Parafrankia sp. Ea1.12 TaxID=573499 RepID=UPI000DA58522|nr:Stk1 family PASTA domain-containing Ser/Thr kinase [Parafrankia sp. Ea1.12]SQD95619.1 Serine/threonine-protein kinase PK-1 [Parafrankia sp. Ea1.12]
MADPVIGRLLDGRYTAQERLAVGGMATVYVAHDNRLDRFVALKIMHPNLSHDPEFVARFHREANAVARLNTPCAVSILDQGSDTSPAGVLHYLVMELVRGRSLRQHLGMRGRLTVAEVVEIFEPVAEALAAAHAAGIIHRDIKPENILLGDDGRVKVADFGLARPVTNPTAALTGGVVMGTVGYLAPEQVTHGTAGMRSDVYAAGVMLFEMITGNLPHTGETPMSVAYQSVHGDVPAPSTVVPDVPAELDALTLRATARDPNHRPADGAALLAELRAILPYLPAPDAGEEYHSGFTGPLAAPPRPAPPRPPAGPQVAPTSMLGTGSGSSSGGRRRAQRTGPGSRLPVGPAVIAAVVVVCLVLGVLMLRSLVGGGKPEVPKLIGLAKADAEQDLRDAGLAFTYGAEIASAQIPQGHVVEQDPKDGAAVSDGAVVTLRLSSGVPKATVPDLAGLTVDQALPKLTEAKLADGGRSSEASDTVPQGQVVRTEPAAGAVVDPSTSVKLVLSSGPSSVAVPSDIIGMTFDEAKARLDSLNLNLTVQQSNVASDSVDPGHVVRSSPDPGQRVNAGGAVTLFVAQEADDDGGDGDGDGDGSGVMVTVPNVVGKSWPDAERILNRLGLNADRSNWFAERVTGQSPKAGRKIEKGSTVHLKTEFRVGN